MSIYVLRSDNLVKIGFTEYLRKRVQSIISTIPVAVEFVGHMPGDRELEAHLHQRFDDHHFSGEWFVETEEMSAVFEAILTPGLPAAETEKSKKRSAEREYMLAVAKSIREAAKARWPLLPAAERVANFRSEIGWNKGRAKDAYYAHPNMALRGFELEELEEWLGEARRSAYAIAPELRDGGDDK